ncbi:MAG TPA: PDZ domain-containing protein [Rhodopila sp.]|nr:PDZ domain-containing protein [Rhodopila sp.]
MANPLSLLSDKISGLVASSQGFLCAVRTASDRHVTGVLIQGDSIITINQSLPPLDVYTAFFPSGAVVSTRQLTRDPVTDLALLKLNDPLEAKPLAGILPPVGSLALIVAADLSGAPTARLSLVHRLVQTSHGLTPVLDVAGGLVEPGAAILDAEGRLIGLATQGAGNTTMAVPAGALIRLVGRTEASAPAVADPAPVEAPATPTNRSGRAWLGISLQPITVPDHLLSKAGQPSGRMVVSVADGGPADRAGLRSGDVLLTLNGTSTSGTNTLRAFLNSERVGSAIEIKLMRDGVLMVATLVVGSQPA